MYSQQFIGTCERGSVCMVGPLYKRGSFSSTMPQIHFLFISCHAFPSRTLNTLFSSLWEHRHQAAQWKKLHKFHILLQPVQWAITCFEAWALFAFFLTSSHLKHATYVKEQLLSPETLTDAG